MNHRRWKMSQLKHEWVTFYSPRNGRLSIQACEKCGVAKGIVNGGHRFSVVSNEEKQNRLHGWTTNAHSNRSHSLSVSNAY